MKHLLIATLLVACAGLVELSAVSVKDVLPKLTSEEIASLEAGETLEKRSTRDQLITDLAPAESAVYQFTDEGSKNLGIGFNVAVARLVPYPEPWKDLDEGQKLLKVYNQMRQIRTIQGITYISKRAGNKPKVLFNKCYSLSDPDDRKTKYEDPMETEVPSELHTYAYLNDTTFDGLVYDMDYTNSDKEIFLNMTNHTGMKFKGIKLVNARQLNMGVSAYLTDEGILTYGLANVPDQEQVVKVLFWSVHLASSFSRRMVSLLDWFQNGVQTI